MASYSLTMIGLTQIHMQESSSTIQDLISWLQRQDDFLITLDNYETLASVADKWDIPALLNDIDVTTHNQRRLTEVIFVCLCRDDAREVDFWTSVLFDSSCGEM
jgi:hypothetical protein